jgi:predicted HicB family RNase H-like nuclease
MNNLLEYKGYFSSPRYSAEDRVFWGKLDGIDDNISFEGTTVSELQSAFEEAVEDYLDTCKRHGMTPKTPLKGHFEVTVTPELHRQLIMFTASRDVTVDQAVETALKGYLSNAG